MSIARKLFDITISDVILMAFATVTVYLIVGGLSVEHVIGVIIGNRIFTVMIK